jgi:hypothetical protein
MGEIIILYVLGFGPYILQADKSVVIPADDFGRIEGLETAIKRRAKGWYSLAEIADQGNPDGTFQRDNDLFYQAAQKLDTLARKYGSAE